MPASLPALAAHLARPDLYWPCTSLSHRLSPRAFVPAYRVAPHATAACRVRQLAAAVAILAERLRRLPEALPHWRHFDAGAYFDLRPLQTHYIVGMERLGATLDITIYADLLSPAFRAAESFWGRSYCPAYHAAGGTPDDAFARHFRQHTQPRMQALFAAARQEIGAAGELLFQRGDLTFLSAAAAPDVQGEHAISHALTGPRPFPTLTLTWSYELA